MSGVKQRNLISSHLKTISASIQHHFPCSLIALFRTIASAMPKQCGHWLICEEWYLKRKMWEKIRTFHGVKPRLLLADIFTSKYPEITSFPFILRLKTPLIFYWAATPPCITNHENIPRKAQERKYETNLWRGWHLPEEEVKLEVAVEDSKVY